MNRTWETWEKGATFPVTQEHPEFITLTWPKNVRMNGACLLWTGFSAVEGEAFTGGENDHVHNAPEASWQRVASAEKTLPEAGVVTLVIEDMANHRVRNLVSETPFPAGENIAWWDGSDDLLRDPEAARHGVYNIPTRPVAPGDYTVRGLWHQPLKLRYEFSIYSAGMPAWETADKTGCWMTTHTPPTSMAAIPGSKTADGEPLVVMGAFVAEGGHGLQWLREDGTKLGGQGWVGGNWTGAPTLAVDLGAKAIEEHACYVGSVWDAELRLTAKTRTMEDKPIFKTQLGADPRIDKPADGTKPPEIEGFDGGEKIYALAGLAAHDGVLVCSMIRQNELLLVDVKTGGITGKVSVENSRGATFDAQGRMLVLSGKKLRDIGFFGNARRDAWKVNRNGQRQGARLPGHHR